MPDSSDRSGLADAVADAIAALSVLAYPAIYARVVRDLEPTRVLRHAADSARRLLRGIALLRAAGEAQGLVWIVEAEPVAEALAEELEAPSRATTPPSGDTVRLARELLRHLLIASGLAEGDSGWDRDRDTVPPLEVWQAPADIPER